jgi:4-amino-4-deoxy-L-arabinose transferase-like glycosyltransferase
VSADPDRSCVRHVALIFAVSVCFEALFLFDWPNPIDEGWPLYAAQRLHAGGTLYRDVFFVFPPGHLLSAWIAYAWDPPGILMTRVLYAGFTVALCIALYALGRRLMPARYALLGALFLAVASPVAHVNQHLFGYRYLVICVAALLVFARHLESGRRRPLLLAGILAGVGACFRLTPAFAASVGIGIAILASGRTPQRCLADLCVYALGVALATAPVIAWIAADAGLPALWRETVVRPALMVKMQSLPFPALGLPATLDRDGLGAWFVALQYRVFGLLYLGYAIALAIAWWRARRSGTHFAPTLLLAVVVFGGVYFTRTLGRSDEGHLASAIAPVCLLLAHLLSRLTEGAAAVRPWLHGAVPVTALAAWILVQGSDRATVPLLRDLVPGTSVAGEAAQSWRVTRANFFDQRRTIRADRARNGLRIVVLDLSAQPMLYVRKGWMGPGWFDVVMPGTFIDDEEEIRFLAHVRASRPSGVVWPDGPFDDRPERAVEVVAPRVARWAKRLGGEDPQR